MLAIGLLALVGWTRVAAAQVIGVSPSPLDFGTLDVGSSTTSSFTIANTGTINPLTITSIAAAPVAGDDCDNFDLPTPPTFPLIIGPSASEDVPAQFAPIIGGPRTCTIAITSDTGGTAGTVINQVLQGTGQRQLTVSTPTLAFGGVAIAAAAATTTFTITNNGAQSYTLLNGDVALSGSTTFSLSPAPTGTIIAGGGNITVTVAFDPIVRGDVTGTITVRATGVGDPTSATVGLTGTGQAPRMTVDPLSLTFAARLITAPASGNQLIRVSNGSGADVSDLDITVSLSAGDTGDFSLAPAMASIAPGGAQDIAVSFKPTVTGVRTATLTIASNDPNNPSINVTLSGTGQENPDIAVTPPSIGFGSQTVAQDSTAQAITITNASGAFRIPLGVNISVEGTHPGDFRVSTTSVSVPAGTSRTVDVIFRPTASDARSARIRIDSNDPDEPSLTVAVSGTGTQPDILVQPGSLLFGDVAVSQASTAQTVTARNNGNATLVITGVSIGGTNPGDFSFSGSTNVTLTPGQSTTWDVVCSPQSTGGKSAAFQIPSNDLDTSTATVALSCNGVAANLALSQNIAFPPTDINTTAPPLTVDLRNDGGLAVTVEALTSSNSVFTVTQAPALPFQVPAGGSVPLTIAFKPTQNISYAAELRVAGNTDSATFSMTGTGIVAEVDVVPASYDFGDVRVAQSSATRSFNIANIATAPFQVISVSIDDAENFNLQWPFAGEVRLEPSPSPSSSVTFQLTATPQVIGTITATVTVQTDIPGASSIQVPVQVTGIAPVLALSQGGIDFGGVDVQAPAPARQALTLSNSGSFELAISNIEITGEGAAFYALDADQIRSTVLAVGQTLAVAVDYAPTVERASELAADLVITSNAYDGATAVIPLRGHGIDRHIAVSALTLSFPETYRNPAEPARLPLEIMNTGKAPLALTMVMARGVGADAFALEGEPAMEDAPAMIVAPGETQVLTVLFAPTAASGAPFRGTLTIVNDDDEKPMVEVALAGVGVAPNVAMSPGGGVLLSGGVHVPIRLSDLGNRIRVTNLDDAAFTVREVRVAELDGNIVEGGPFRVTGFTPGTLLEPGDSLALDVVFEAVAPGTYEGLVLLYLDEDPEPVSFVTVRGKAVDVTLRGGGCSAGADAGPGAVLLMLATLLLVSARRRRRRRIGLIVGLAWLAGQVTTGATAHAGDDARNLDLSTFRPAPAVEGDMLSVESVEVGEPGAWAVGLSFHHAVNPLTVRSADERMVDAPITARTVAELGFAYAFGGRYEAGAAVPLLQQSGDAPAFSGLSPAQGTALGDAALHGKAALWHGGPLALAASATLILPTATDGQFAGGSGLGLHARGIAGYGTRRVRVAANAGLRLRGASTLGNVERGNELTYGVAAAYRLQQALSAVGELFGTAGLGASGAASTLEGVAGVRYRLDRRLAMAAGVGRGLMAGVGAPDLRAFLLVSYSPEARAIPVLVVPAAPVPIDDSDSDSDGIIDANDACPAEREDLDGFADEDGCLDPDNDDDGIIDHTDACPDKAEDLDGFEDEDGCPEGDNDGDGLADEEDQCPEVPEDKDGFQDQDGCDDPDNDRDGVPDVIDQCPLEAETINGKADQDGCPDEGESLVLLLNDRLEPIEPIEFRGNGARLHRRSEDVLDQVAAVLRAHPELLRVRIGVHVHPSGTRDQELSESRAEVIKDHLMRQGIQSERLEARGHGSSRPLLDGRRRDARAVNERIELVIVKRRDQGNAEGQ